jgi:F0F1-type ATP synthase alpha subunit
MEICLTQVRPAINVGISVSRAGGNAQIKSNKSIRYEIRSAQFREWKFAKFVLILMRYQT